jgi:hypothetical protein
MNLALFACVGFDVAAIVSGELPIAALECE